MVPDYISEKVMDSLKHDIYTCMGCRSFLTPDRFTDAGVGNISKAKNYVPGKHRYYGRFNQGVVTVNLVDIAMSAKREVGESASASPFETASRGGRRRRSRFLAW